MPAPLPPSPPRCSVVGLAIVAVVLVLGGLDSGAARGDEAGQWVVGLSAGGAQLRVDERWRPGLQLGAEGRYGLADFWALRGALHVGWHPGDDGPRAFAPVQTGTAAFGLAYAWDVLRWVPFAEAGLVVMGIRGDVSQSSLFGGVQLGAGVDYLIDRDWALGACLRFQHLALGVAMDQTPADAPMQLALLLRLERRF